MAVRNVGTQFGGRAVVQGYVQMLWDEGVEGPEVVLRDFGKTGVLKSASSSSSSDGGEEEVVLRLTRKDVSYWSVEKQNWVVPSRGVVVWLGEASDRLGWACYTETGVCEGGLKGPGAV